MRFLANENIPLPSIRLLRQAGYDITAIIEDSPGIPDTSVLARAAGLEFQQRFTVLSRDQIRQRNLPN